MIKIENVNYGYKSKQPIFNDISLEVGSGIYGLLGENGVGKTTLMHLICGLLFPWKGECKIDNCNSAQRSPELLSHYFFLPEEMQMPLKAFISLPPIIQFSILISVEKNLSRTWKNYTLTENRNCLLSPTDSRRKQCWPMP